MSCFRPLAAYSYAEGGKRVVKLLGNSVAPTSGGVIELPCGKCVGCRLERARAWSIRIGHEAQCWDSNLFVTFDYSPEHLRSWSLYYPDFQGFMRRLRKKYGGVSVSPRGGRPLRFFVAGEYGEQYGRPHWHAILFNLHLPDEEEYKNGTFRSTNLERLWGMGNCVIGRVTPQSAAYVAGYTQSKAYGRPEAYEDLVDSGTGEVGSRRPEFCVMSRDPGIGAFWYDRFSGDLFPHDSAVQDGKEFKVPRYYVERLKREFPLKGEEVAYGRYLRAKEVDPLESSEERRAVREEVAQARVSLFSERSH